MPCLFSNIIFNVVGTQDILIGQWSSWGDCFPGCNGTQTRKRECLFGDCKGPFMESRACNVTHGNISIISVKVTIFNSCKSETVSACLHDKSTNI